MTAPNQDKQRKPMPIEYPWIIVHQPGGEGNPVRTILAGRTGASYKEFGLLICDIIRHVAAGMHVTEKEVFECVEKEYRKPTTDITIEYQTPKGRA